MQLHKFYGRTLKRTLARVRRELGEDVLIVETRTLTTDGPAARMNPGARFEVCAAREAPGAFPLTRRPVGQRRPNPEVGDFPSTPTDPRRAASLLEDLGRLRAQIRELLDDASPEDALRQGRLDLADYQGLIEQGVDHRVLAPHFRRWLEWRTASPALRRYLALTSPADRMQSDSLREWLWHVWREQQGLADDDQVVSRSSALEGRIVGLLGATGVGKTTTLAKMSSKLRQTNRQNIAILTLDTHRFGAVEQIRSYSKLLGVPVHEIVTQEDLERSMESWDRFDWIGIDTPGAMNPTTPAGRLYGAILARRREVQTLLLLPAAQHEAVSREQMERARPFGTERVLFSKLDESSRPATMVNLTMDAPWKIDSITTGQRVPDDWEPVSSQLLWSRVLCPTPSLSPLE